MIYATIVTDSKPHLRVFDGQKKIVDLSLTPQQLLLLAEQALAALRETRELS